MRDDGGVSFTEFLEACYAALRGCWCVVFRSAGIFLAMPVASGPRYGSARVTGNRNPVRYGFPTTHPEPRSAGIAEAQTRTIRILVGDGRARKLTATWVPLAGQVGWSHPGAYSNGSPLRDESLPTGYSPNRESHHGECW